ncbi:unnamed protein product [Ambrosiozyma monospora]|uniref:Unnamed protein product n=1 Tax=Ambrosiozyma monospora TaxID=43982 RepID=A0A9W7DGI8_AMBMO|nr:unnamed protein product [Ambrosiozyma monospora]
MSSESAIERVPQPVCNNTPSFSGYIYMVSALNDFESADEDTLSFKKDEIIPIVETVNAEWLRGRLQGKLGLISANSVEKIPPAADQQQLQELTTTLKQVDIHGILSQLMDVSRQQKGSRTFRTFRKLHKLRKICKMLIVKMKPVLGSLITVLELCDALVQIWNVVAVALMICAFLI